MLDFPPSDGRPPTDEEICTLEVDEVFIFIDFFTVGLRFPCDGHLLSLLDRFSMKIHQLTPNAFLELSKFFWIMQTFDCEISADIFARLSNFIFRGRLSSLTMKSCTRLIMGVALLTLLGRMHIIKSSEFSWLHAVTTSSPRTDNNIAFM